ncbi:hypothetical protein PoB_004307900 [Plakobranchus ocellatus]|uniref:Uncharacterized protein n=1 Tax=Plakobranchus ocellatus TaxID=259542 RepID=A0AAV4BDY6_9GAST|nr:hypothetical protein PoB_004307900 [Plakobranchus ocellatus]
MWTSMAKGWHSISTACLLSLVLLHSPVSAQTGNYESFFADLKQQLEEDFSPAIASLNETWQAFLQARSDMNTTTAQAPWLVEAYPGSEKVMFDLAGLASFKAKVMEMVKQKNKYLAERARLRQDMMQAVYNLSLPYFQAIQGEITDQSAEGTESKASLMNVIRKIFGLKGTSELSANDADDDGDGDNDKNDDNESNKDNIANDKDDVEDKQLDGDSLVDEFLTFSSSQPHKTDSPSTTTSKTASLPKGRRQTSTIPLGPTPSATTRDTEQGDPWYHGNIWGKKYPWSLERAKSRQDYLKKKIQQSIENRKRWQQFAQRRSRGKPSPLPEKTIQEPIVGADANQTVEEIKAKLWKEFGPTIKKLNDSKNEYLQAKENMVEAASQRTWQHKSADGNFTIFNPVALMAFKSKIKEMVVTKSKYLAEKAQLKQDMLEELQELLLAHLNEVEESSKSGETNSETALASVAQMANSILEEMVEVDGDSGDNASDDVMEGLPFGGSLMLAVAPPDDTAGNHGLLSGSGKAGEVAALVVFGVLAVVAAAAIVMGVALRRSGHSGLYTRLD